ncbi:uncharacterized protein LOC142353976 isoform X2 [Convolutriloba macropyga]|uniref:uncharacterized protein LOC142353976 isoform X2 n=1 Tax=Convolutriloba macropyga TaxID=536237 RepID=UPI003F528ADE
MSSHDVRSHSDVTRRPLRPVSQNVANQAESSVSNQQSVQPNSCANPTGDPENSLNLAGQRPSNFPQEQSENWQQSRTNFVSENRRGNNVEVTGRSNNFQGQAPSRSLVFGPRFQPSRDQLEAYQRSRQQSRILALDNEAANDDIDDTNIIGGNDWDIFCETEEEREQRRREKGFLDSFEPPTLQFTSYGPMRKEPMNAPAFKLDFLERGRPPAQKVWPLDSQPQAEWPQLMLENALWPVYLRKGYLLPAFNKEEDRELMPGYKFDSVRNDYSEKLGNYVTLATTVPLREIKPKTNTAAMFLSPKLMPRYVFPEYSVLMIRPLLADSPKRLYLLPPLHYVHRTMASQNSAPWVFEGTLKVSQDESWGRYRLKRGYFWYKKRLLLLEENAVVIMKCPPQEMRMVILFSSKSQDHPDPTQPIIQSLIEDMEHLGRSRHYLNAQTNRLLQQLLATPELVAIADTHFSNFYLMMKVFVCGFYRKFLDALIPQEERNDLAVQDQAEILELFYLLVSLIRKGYYNGPAPPLNQIQSKMAESKTKGDPLQRIKQRMKTENPKVTQIGRADRPFQPREYTAPGRSHLANSEEQQQLTSTLSQPEQSRLESAQTSSKTNPDVTHSS